jgi:hypothetical protein
MKLAASDSNNSIGLDRICDDNGNPFPSQLEHGKYITEFYEKLYRRPIGPEREGS